MIEKHANQDIPGSKEDERSADIDHLLFRLRHLTRMMRLIGQTTFVMCLGGFIAAFAELSFRGESIRSYIDDRLTMLKILTLFLSLAGFCAIAFFETLRRQGDVLFDELSNELQWGGPTKRGGSAVDDKPPISRRIILRNFVQASDLPLVPGRFGPAVYGLVFIALALGAYFIAVPFQIFH